MALSTLALTLNSPPADPGNLMIVDDANAPSAGLEAFDRATLERLYVSQRKHFWFASRNTVIVDMMQRAGLVPPARFLEVGCGTGTVLGHLLECGYAADGVEMRRGRARQAAINFPQARIYCLDATRLRPSSLDVEYQGIGLFDVLEHVADYSGFLSACADLACPGGVLVGTVPALMFLWSALDEVAGHRRRYDRATLRCELQAAGLDVLFLRYFFQVLVPAIWLQRVHIRHTRIKSKADRAAVVRHGIRVPPRPVNAVFRAACFGERALRSLCPLGRIPGASLLFIARKHA